MRRLIHICLTLILSGCSSIPRTSNEANTAADDTKITADAFLFDARIYREGKPTSVRLECYHSDSIVGLSARGYLGKGALRGKVTRDSIIVYFPSTNEYVAEKVTDLLSSADSCTAPSGDIDLAAMFSNLPDIILRDTGFVVKSIGDDNNPEFSISLDSCGWVLILGYGIDDEMNYLDRIEFNGGNGNRLKAKRRTLKRQTQIPLNRFEPRIPPSAIRIIP